MQKKELKVGMRIRLIRGSGGGTTANWIAGSVPVGACGTVYVSENGTPAVKFDNIEPNGDNGWFGLASDSLYNEKQEMFEEIL